MEEHILHRKNVQREHLLNKEFQNENIQKEKLQSGRIIKLLGGFYYVLSGKEIFECRARGLFRKNDIKPVVGDLVDFQLDSLHANKGYILDVHERKNILVRPEVSNIDQLVIVFAVKSPNPNLFLLDSLLLHCDINGIKPLLCFNKVDLADDFEIAKLQRIYSRLGIELLFTSEVKKIGLEKLKWKLENKISAFSGPSGVGKSSLISSVLGIELKRGDISKKIERGKHTTRHCELLPIEGCEDAFICDTPGFSTPQNLYLDYREIKEHFYEFKEHNSSCKFKDCLHIDEPSCHIKDLLEEKKIDANRYESYKLMVKNSKQMNKELL